MKRGPRPKPKTMEQLARQAQNLGPLIKPDDLDPGVAKIWDEQAPRARGVKSGDSAAFADFCLCIYRLRQCEEIISKTGLLVNGTKGIRKNPASQLAREYRLAIQRWAPEFGLTPAAGTKIEIFGGPSQTEKSSKPAIKPGLLSGQWDEQLTGLKQ